MSSRLLIPIASSADVQFNITDLAQDGDAYDMSAALGIVILLYDKLGVIWGRFSQEQTAYFTDYSPIDVSQADDGILKFKISEEQSVRAAPGKIYMDLKIAITDAEGTNLDRHLILAKVDVGDTVDSLIKNLPTHDGDS